MEETREHVLLLNRWNPTCQARTLCLMDYIVFTIFLRRKFTLFSIRIIFGLIFRNYCARNIVICLIRECSEEKITWQYSLFLSRTFYHLIWWSFLWHERHCLECRFVVSLLEIIWSINASLIQINKGMPKCVY